MAAAIIVSYHPVIITTTTAAVANRVGSGPVVYDTLLGTDALPTDDDAENAGADDGSRRRDGVSIHPASAAAS